MIEPDRIIEYLNSINLPGDCWNKPFISIYIHLGQWLEDLGWLICGFSTWLFFRNSHMVQSEINWQLAAFQVFGWREKLGFLLAKTQSVAWFNTINTTMNSFLPGWISPKMMPWDIHAWGSLQKKPLAPCSNPNLGFKLLSSSFKYSPKKKNKEMSMSSSIDPVLLILWYSQIGDFPFQWSPNMAPDPWDPWGFHGFPTSTSCLIHQLQKALWAGRGVLRALDGFPGVFWAEGVALS